MTVDELKDELTHTLILHDIQLREKEVDTIARAALAHIGERRGIEFEGMSDELLPTIRMYFDKWGLKMQVIQIDAELARRAAAKPAEKDEWREAIITALEETERWPRLQIAEQILAAIAPLRERLETTAGAGEVALARAGGLVKERDLHKQRAEAAEAKLKRIMEAVQHVIGAHGCGTDDSTQ